MVLRHVAALPAPRGTVRVLHHLLGQQSGLACWPGTQSSCPNKAQAEPPMPLHGFLQELQCSFAIARLDIIKAFRRACHAFGIEDLHFHDLGHEVPAASSSWAGRSGRRPASLDTAFGRCCSGMASSAWPAPSRPNGNDTRRYRFGQPDDTRSGWQNPQQSHRIGLQIPIRYSTQCPVGPHRRPLGMSGATHRWEET